MCIDMVYNYERNVIKNLLSLLMVFNQTDGIMWSFIAAYG